MLASYLFCRSAAGLLRRMGACCVLCNMLWRQHANICTPVSPACSFLAACLQCWAAHGHRHVLPAARPAGPEHDAPGGGGPAVRARTPTCTAVHLYLRPPFWPVPGVRAYACRSCRWILHCPSLTKTAGSCSLTKPLTMFPPTSPPPAFRLMSPIALAENSPSCPRSGEGDLVLPNGTPWCRQLLMLLFTTKVLNEANGLLKPGGCQAGRQGWRGGEKREGDVGGWMGEWVGGGLAAVWVACASHLVVQRPGSHLQHCHPLTLPLLRRARSCLPFAACRRGAHQRCSRRPAVHGRHEGAAPGLAALPPGRL